MVGGTGFPACAVLCRHSLERLFHLPLLERVAATHVYLAAAGTGDFDYRLIARLPDYLRGRPPALAVPAHRLTDVHRAAKSDLALLQNCPNNLLHLHPFSVMLRWHSLSWLWLHTRHFTNQL
jgi:hypothetical protein